MIRFLLAEHRRHPWILPGIGLTFSAAFGTWLPTAVAAIRAVLS